MSAQSLMLLYLDTNVCVCVCVCLIHTHTHTIVRAGYKKREIEVAREIDKQ